MQCVVRQGEDFVFAVHRDDVPDVEDLYPALELVSPVDGSIVSVPQPDVVPTRRGLAFAYDGLARPMEPRRCAGEGGTPLDPKARVALKPGQGARKYLGPSPYPAPLRSEPTTDTPPPPTEPTT